MIRKQLRRFTFAFSGIWHALKTDRSFQVSLTSGIAAIGIFSWYFWPLTPTELLFLFLGWVLILITELQNSSFEAALDRIHPERHDDIGKSKDMAAGAVLLAALFTVGVMVVIAFFRTI